MAVRISLTPMTNTLLCTWSSPACEEGEQGQLVRVMYNSGSCSGIWFADSEAKKLYKEGSSGLALSPFRPLPSLLRMLPRGG